MSEKCTDDSATEAKAPTSVSGSCHCGAVQIEVDVLPSTLTQCTCSVCHRYGAQWAFCTRSTARVSDPEGVLTPYEWGDRLIEFYHCSRCGCLTHYEGKTKAPQERLAVNARLLPPTATAALTLRTFDGADTWAYLDEG